MLSLCAAVKDSQPCAYIGVTCRKMHPTLYLKKRTHGQEQQGGVCRGSGLVEMEKGVGGIHGMERIK